jgi:hypothetical protein
LHGKFFRWGKATLGKLTILALLPLPLPFQITTFPIRYFPIERLQKLIIAMAVGQRIALLEDVLVLGIKFGVRISSASPAGREKQCGGDLLHYGKFLAASQDGSDDVGKIEHKARRPSADQFGEKIDFVAVLAGSHKLADAIRR